MKLRARDTPTRSNKSKDETLEIRKDSNKSSKAKDKTNRLLEETDRVIKLNKKLDKRKTQAIKVLEQTPMIQAVPQEQDHMEAFLHILTKLQSIVQIAESKYEETGSTREVYALMAMYSQLRETIADIRTITDSSQQVETLITEVLRPLAKSFGQSISSVFYQVKKLLIEAQNSKDIQQQIVELERHFSELGTISQNDYENACAKLSQVYK